MIKPVQAILEDKVNNLVTAVIKLNVFVNDV